MSQINVNGPPPAYGEERSGASGATMVAILLAVVVVAVVAWMLFSGVFSGPSASTTNVNVTTPAQSQPAQKDTPNVNINLPKVDVNTPGQSQPAQQPAQQP